MKPLKIFALIISLTLLLSASKTKPEKLRIPLPRATEGCAVCCCSKNFSSSCHRTCREIRGIKNSKQAKSVLTDMTKECARRGALSGQEKTVKILVQGIEDENRFKELVQSLCPMACDGPPDKGHHH